jgi:hypothetical protein
VDAQETARWWARIRAAGPQLVPAGGVFPAGLRPLTEPAGSRAWLIPVLPNGAGPAVLDELDLPHPVLEQPNDTARVLAAALKCCWADPSGPLWPGVGAPFGQVAATFEAITGRDELVSHRALVAALRRLSWSGWLIWDEQQGPVRLGPRVATWRSTELSTLRELCRSIPVPEPGPPAAVATGPAPAAPQRSVEAGEDDR